MAITKKKGSSAPRAKAPSKKAASASPSSNGRSSVAKAKKSTVSPKPNTDRLPVLKTYKIFIGGKFPRTESGRYYQPLSPGPAPGPSVSNNTRSANNTTDPGARPGIPLGNICLGSRKDMRNAVQAARKAQGPWAGRTAYNRSQILYRIGEMLEGRAAQFVDELILQGATKVQAQAQVNEAIDRCIYYAGWCDKYQQLFSSVNPVASQHFNFTVQEPTGVVALVAPSNSPLLGLVSSILPIIAGGNTVVVMADENKPLSAVSFAEVLATSDVPGGVVNIITGKTDELLKPTVQHMDVNAIVVYDSDQEERTFVQTEAVANLKRCIFPEIDNWFEEGSKSPYAIVETQEAKTTWHPIEVIGSGGSGY